MPKRHGERVDLLSIRDLTRDQIDGILDSSDGMLRTISDGHIPQIMTGRVLATLFFEPSTRTRLSFASAMQRMGGSTIGFEGTQTSAIAKGENLADTIRIVERYSDMLVIRHPREGAARYSAQLSEKPVINAGDGSNQHPTQTLVDLYTIRRLKGAIPALKVTLLGDLKHARVVRSLAYALAMYGTEMVLASPPGLEIASDVREELTESFSARLTETSDMDEAVSGADVLYVCRIQRERFQDVYEAEKLQKSFMVTESTLERAKPDLIILHALPKVNEIAPEVDRSERARYFDQAGYGIPVRMAVLQWVMQ